MITRGTLNNMWLITKYGTAAGQRVPHKIRCSKKQMKSEVLELLSSHETLSPVEKDRGEIFTCSNIKVT